MLNRIVLKFGPVPGASPLTFDPLRMTVFVGPNNSGKSLILREIYGQASLRNESQDPPEKIIDSLEVRFPPSSMSKILVDSVSTSYSADKPPDGCYWAAWENSRTAVDKSEMTINLVKGRIEQERGLPVPSATNKKVLTQLVSQLTLKLDGKTRLTLTEEQPLGDLLLDTKHHLARLVTNEDARKRVCELIYQAFGVYFVFCSRSDKSW